MARRTFLSFAAIVAGVLIPSVLGGQIPVVDGVLGGVSQDIPIRLETTPRPAQVDAAGQLRVTENSGVCGMSN
jgi:hypothetical protein